MNRYENAFSSFAVDDLDLAQKFYEQSLGLEVKRLEMGLLQLELDGTKVIIYPKDDYTPATFTVLNFKVADIDSTVDELSSNGIDFERYDGFDMDDKNISRGNGPSVAWFKDPAGNILSVMGSWDSTD